MPASAVETTLANFHRREYFALQDVAKIARGLLAVLRDHHLENTANELAEALARVDIVHTEMEELLRKDPQAVLAMLRAMAERAIKEP